MVVAVTLSSRHQFYIRIEVGMKILHYNAYMPWYIDYLANFSGNYDTFEIFLLISLMIYVDSNDNFLHIFHIQIQLISRQLPIIAPPLRSCIPVTEISWTNKLEMALCYILNILNLAFLEIFV